MDIAFALSGREGPWARAAKALGHVPRTLNPDRPLDVFARWGIGLVVLGGEATTDHMRRALERATARGTRVVVLGPVVPAVDASPDSPPGVFDQSLACDVAVHAPARWSYDEYVAQGLLDSGCKLKVVGPWGDSPYNLTGLSTAEMWNLHRSAKVSLVLGNQPELVLTVWAAGGFPAVDYPYAVGVSGIDTGTLGSQWATGTSAELVEMVVDTLSRMRGRKENNPIRQDVLANHTYQNRLAEILSSTC